jgi:DNA mismatch repair protein MutL
MGRIHVLPEHVANKIAAGEVVERPASVVKELLENALDAGATRIRVSIEAGGKRLIQVVDNGCGMVRDDAMLAFERHATSKIKNADDLLNITTLGFRGEALPSIASVSRLRLETAAEPQPTGVVPHDSTGTLIDIAGGKLLRVEEAGLPQGTSITVRDLFFNTPARKKFLRSEATELSHIASLVTNYALAHPEKHFELHSATNAILVVAPVASHSERLYQVFGKDTRDQLLHVAAVLPLERMALQRPPWARDEDLDDEEPRPQLLPGELRLHGFVSKPEVQKLNRNSIFTFVNGRLIRDRLIQHALTDAYRNILPPTVYPVVLLFLEMPYTEVDANVHPSKTEVRFRQQQAVHDFVRDAVRQALMKARPVPQFTTEIRAHPTAAGALTPPVGSLLANDGPIPSAAATAAKLELSAPAVPPHSARLEFSDAITVTANAAIASARMPHDVPLAEALPRNGTPHRFAPNGDALALVPENGHACALPVEAEDEGAPEPAIATLKPLGQIRNSFILAVNAEGLWIIDQHVAHERVLFERVQRQRAASRVETQRLLMPMIVELTPGQQAVFTEMCDELRHNGFEVEPFGTRTIAVKMAPAGLEAADLERLLHEILDQLQREEQRLNLDMIRNRIAASIACHAAIKVNMPLEHTKMEWLLRELAKTECPMSCPHGRPVVLRYSVRDIQKAFKRI